MLNTAVFAISNYFSQKLLNQTPLVQRQIRVFSLTLENSERPRRARLDDPSRSRRWLLPTLPSFTQFEGDWH